MQNTKHKKIGLGGLQHGVSDMLEEMLFKDSEWKFRWILNFWSGVQQFPWQFLAGNLSVTAPADPRVEKIFLFVANFGRWKTFRKCQWNIFKRPEKG